MTELTVIFDLRGGAVFKGFEIYPQKAAFLGGREGSRHIVLKVAAAIYDVFGTSVNDISFKTLGKNTPVANQCRYLQTKKLYLRHSCIPID
eukprot:3172256-Amphidinium_carterae.1